MNNKSNPVPALDRTLGIFELISYSRIGLTLSELSRSLNAPMRSVHYLLLTLERRRYLYRNEITNRFLCGLKILRIARGVLNKVELRRHAAPYLRLLRDKTGFKTHLSILGRDQAVVVDKMQALGLLRLATWVGKRMDLHCSGIGKAILAHRPDVELDRLARDHGFSRYNGNTIITRKRIREVMVLIGKRGYALRTRRRARLSLHGMSDLRPTSANWWGVSVAGTISIAHWET